MCCFSGPSGRVFLVFVTVLGVNCCASQLLGETSPRLTHTSMDYGRIER
ncbi:hypothetical protein DAI22_01g458300 [Oryza sativa Japonica Group]|nr:hypothetical protein DAI22_01g458300 [Oryza sativa Japonica Group]